LCSQFRFEYVHGGINILIRIAVDEPHIDAHELVQKEVPLLFAYAAAL
jgi:hypothetical protein